MKHDEQCEIRRWIRFYPDTWPQCWCAERAYAKNPFDEQPIYSAENIYEMDEL